MVTDGNENHKKWCSPENGAGGKSAKNIAVCYHKGDWTCHFLPFEGCFLFYRRLSRIRHFSAEKLQVTTIFLRGFTLPELPFPIETYRLQACASYFAVRKMLHFCPSGVNFSIRLLLTDLAVCAVYELLRAVLLSNQPCKKDGKDLICSTNIP